MSTQEKPPREWWIRDNCKEYGLPPQIKYKYACFDSPNGVEGDLIHVIEYSAYESLRRDWAEAERRLHDKFAAALVERDLGETEK